MLSENKARLADMLGYFTKIPNAPEILHKISEAADGLGRINIMEICGTHTMSIAKTALKSLLPENIHLISGPGCPVCVTPAGAIDNILDLASKKDIILASYGDMLRIPGCGHSSLMDSKARGCDIRIVYSPAAALDLAKKNPGKEIVFLGVGFETTAPGTASCILDAAEGHVQNFSVLCLLKRTEPALRSLINAPDFAVNAFLCPGHVAAVTGSVAFSFLADEYRLPAVVSGFEAADLLYSVYILVKMIKDSAPKLVNEYMRIVKPEGNTEAMDILNKVFDISDSMWRGLGEVRRGGYGIKKEYSAWDAEKKFSLPPVYNKESPGCLCAEIIRGVKTPVDCPLFGKACTPEAPAGPCMVSSEGSCAAAWKYGF
jgi:hydrogenase expression/formation protein HypD